MIIPGDQSHKFAAQKTNKLNYPKRTNIKSPHTQDLPCHLSKPGHVQQQLNLNQESKTSKNYRKRIVSERNSPKKKMKMADNSIIKNALLKIIFYGFNKPKASTRLL